MAAILCRGLGIMCSGTLPCKVCSVGCDTVSHIINNPFFLYLAISVGLNIPPVLAGIRAVSELGRCSQATQWLLIDALLSACHIFAAFYLVHKIQQEDGIEQTQTSAAVVGETSKVESGTYYAEQSEAGEEKTPRNSITRIRHILCEDKWMALYILIGIAWMVWQAVGVIRSVETRGDDECADIHSWVNTSVICGWLYFSLAGVAFLLSICCL